VSLLGHKLGHQWWATVTFKVTTLPLPLLKKKKSEVTSTTVSKNSSE